MSQRLDFCGKTGAIRSCKVKDDRRIMLSVVTDGIPTSTQSNAKDEFMRELRGFLDHLNAFVVIRLATDDDEVATWSLFETLPCVSGTAAFEQI